MVHKVISSSKSDRWEKMIETSDMLVYGKPNAKDVLIAEKWKGGWSIDRAMDVTPKAFKGEWKFKGRSAVTNVSSKAEARKEIMSLIHEGHSKSKDGSWVPWVKSYPEYGGV